MHLQSQTKAVCERIIAEWEMHCKLPPHNTEQLTTVLLLSKRGLIFFFQHDDTQSTAGKIRALICLSYGLYKAQQLFIIDSLW